MATRIDTRQIRNRESLSNITPDINKQLNDLLSLIDSELTIPLRLIESDTPDRIINIESIIIQNEDTELSRTIHPINGILPNFTSGTIELPAASGNDIVVNPGENISLNIANDKFKKMLILIDSDGDLRLILGEDKDTKAEAHEEKILFNFGRAIGHVIIYNDNGDIQNVVNDDITQYVGNSADSFNVQDNNMKLIKGGTWSWNLTAEELSFDDDAYVQIPALNEDRNTIQYTVQSPIVLDDDGKCAYVYVNRYDGVADNLTINVDDIADIPGDADVVIIARRAGDEVLVGKSSFRLIDGESKALDAGISDQNRELLGSNVTEATSQPEYSTRGAAERTISNSEGILDAVASMDAEIDKFFGQLQLVEHPTNGNRIIVTGIEHTMKNDTLLSQEMNNLLLKFDGAEIDFSTGEIYESDGVTALGVNFTPFTIPTDEYFWYSVTLIPSAVNTDGSINAQLLILPASGSAATKDDAPKPALAEGKKLGMVVVKEEAGSIADIAQADIVQFGVAGSANGVNGISGAGFGLALDELPFRVAFGDTFRNEDLTDDDETTATFSIVNRLYEIEYDATKEITTAGTNFDLDGVPSFDVKIGDVIKVADEVRKIVSLGNINVDGTGAEIDEEFSSALTDEPCTVSQKVQTVDCLNYFDDEDPESRPNSELVGHILLSDKDTNDFKHAQSPEWLYPQVDDIILQYVGGELKEAKITAIIDDENFTLDDGTDIENGPAFIIRPIASYMVTYRDSGWVDQIDIAYSAITDKDEGESWAAEKVNERNLSPAHDVLKEHIDGEAGGHFYVRFFANRTSGSGSVTLYEYDSAFYEEADFNNGGIHYQSWARTDEEGTPVNCLLSVEGGKTRITFIDKFPGFVAGINPGGAWGNLQVYLNGTEIPRFINGDLTPNAYYTEDPNGRYIDLDQDYSSFAYSIGVSIRIGTKDTSDDNAALLAGNHLGSPNAAIDMSVAGRGIFLRRPDGTLRELTIDDDDNVAIYSVD